MTTTRDARASAININTRFGLLPEPGTITQPDRQHVGRMYRDITAGGFVPPSPSTALLLPWIRRRKRKQ